MHSSSLSTAPAEFSADVITVGGRQAWVYQRALNGVRGGNYYVKGYVPGGKEFFRSTGFSTKGMALDAARKLWKAALEGRLEALAATKIRKDQSVATMGDILKAHERAEKQGRLHVEAKVARQYRGQLALAVAIRQGLADVPEGAARRRCDLEAVRKVSLEVLAAKDFVPELELAYTRAAGADRVQRERLLRGLHSLLRNARAMFTQVARRAYEGLKVPEMKHFMEMELRVPREVQHAGLTDAAVAEMALAALELKTTNPALYLVHLCFRNLGMRDDEIFEARREWIEERAGEVRLPGERRKVRLEDGTELEVELPQIRKVAGWMVIELREYWEPKASEGEVALAPEVLAEMLPLLAGRAPQDYLIDAGTKTERWELVYRTHADFVRPWTKHLAARSYELRRWGASLISRLHQNEAMADIFLRHAKRTTAQKHYLTGARPLPAPITLADVGL